MTSTTFQVSIAGIKRTGNNSDFTQEDYEICLARESQIGAWAFPTCSLTGNFDPCQIASDYLKQITGINCGQIFSLDVISEFREPVLYMTLCYVAVVPLEATLQTRPSIEVKFEPLCDTITAIDDSSLFNQSNIPFIHRMVSWLRDQHVDKLVMVDKLFSSGSESVSIPISIRALLSNPLSERNVIPQEDKLLVQLDNPVFHFLIN